MERMIIDLRYNNSWTFAHFIEQNEGCDHRYLKGFSGVVVDGDKTYGDTYYMLVRDLEKGIITNVEPMGEILEKEGIVKVKKIGESLVKLMKCGEAYRRTALEMKKNPRILYSIV
jgi:aminoglycoside 3-N-acetyltransferase